MVVDELNIRLVSSPDAQILADYFLKNRAFLQPWEPIREESFFTCSGWEKRIIQLTELHKYNLAYYFLIQQQDSEQVCGVITYSNVIRHPFHSCYVGYSLDEEMQGQGIMRRALLATNQWLFDHQNLHRIMAAYIPSNTRSGRVLTAAGFEKEGLAKDYLLINGKWEDHVLTALTNPNWSLSDE